MSITLDSLRFPISYVQLAEQIATYQGRDFSSLLESTLHVDAAELENPQALINGIQFAKLLDITRDFIEEGPDAQIQWIKFFPLTIHGYVGLAAMMSATIRQALDLAVRFFYQVMPAYEMEYFIEEERCKIRFTRLADFGKNNDLLLETVFCAINSFLKVADFPYDDVKIEISHKDLVLSDFESLYSGLTIISGCKENIFSFPADLLDTPITTANNATLKMIEQELENQQASLTQCHTLGYQVSSLINQRLKDGDPVELADIAKALKQSTRTLSRRLQAEGTTFKAIHNHCRLSMAKAMLTESGQNISQIAHALGFSNEASFSRYIKQQTGKSPVQYRADARR